jgi:hypothetical protein
MANDISDAGNYFRRWKFGNDINAQLGGSGATIRSTDSLGHINLIATTEPFSFPTSHFGKKCPDGEEWLPSGGIGGLFGQGKCVKAGTVDRTDGGTVDKDGELQPPSTNPFPSVYPESGVGDSLRKALGLPDGKSLGLILLALVIVAGGIYGLVK